MPKFPIETELMIVLDLIRAWGKRKKSGRKRETKRKNIDPIFRKNFDVLFMEKSWIFITNSFFFFNVTLQWYLLWLSFWPPLLNFASDTSPLSYTFPVLLGIWRSLVSLSGDKCKKKGYGEMAWEVRGRRVYFLRGTGGGQWRLQTRLCLNRTVPCYGMVGH